MKKHRDGLMASIALLAVLVQAVRTFDVPIWQVLVFGFGALLEWASRLLEPFITLLAG